MTGENVNPAIKKKEVIRDEKEKFYFLNPVYNVGISRD